MTALRKDAINLIENVPEDKLYFVIELLRGVNGLYKNDDQEIRDRAFAELESLRKKIPNLDYDKALEEWREEKYGYKSAN